MAEILKLVPQDKNGRDYLGFWMMECIFLNPDNRIMFGGLPKPYEYADLDLKSINPSEVSPTAKYVLKSQLNIIENLDKELSTQGFDMFNLDGVLKIDENNYICPPILEVWKEKPYNGNPVIVDGAHRLYIARKRGINVSCMVISGNISSMLPMLPLKGWEEVLEQDTVPKDKRNYHPGIPIPWKPHELYRQRFHGSKGPRIYHP